ncbi:batten's disease protein Cln3 [Tirmania nivea]|nr:batten's disease protein Cln3 [Tirmania nivea]
MECEEARKWHGFRVFMSFWILGCLATMQFIVVVTASNDLVGNQAPLGLILFAYTLPSVLIRAFVPYIRFLTIRFFNYPFRLTVCCLSSFIGLQLLSFAPTLPLRVMGIMLTSLSSNLGDMTFYQLAPRYPLSIAKSFGGCAAGSGVAGLLGSGVYTLLTGVGGVGMRFVLAGMGLVPAIMVGTYFGVLPDMEVGGRHGEDADDGSEDDVLVKRTTGLQFEKIKDLAVRDKLRLVMPMVWGYMLPLATLMLLENTTIQGILPDTVFHLPPQFWSIASGLFKSTRDFYPTYITIYQLFVFFGRTSINFFRFPNLPSPYGSMIYWCLCLFEFSCFLVQLGESFSLVAAGEDDSKVWFGPGVMMAIIELMGLCGGLGMSNTYWRVSKEALPQDVWRILGEIRRSAKEREYQGWI